MDKTMDVVVYVYAQFVSRKLVDSQKMGKTYYFADFVYDGNTFSVFLSADDFNQLDSCVLGQHVSLIYEPRVYNNKLQFNLKQIEVI